MKKIVVTGMGVVSPNGVGVPLFRKNLFDGVSGVSNIERFDASMLPTKIAGEVKEVKGVKLYRDIKISFALMAAKEAISMAFGDKKSFADKKAYLSIGLGLELFSMQDLIDYKNHKSPSLNEEERMMFLNTPSDLCLHLLNQEYQFSLPPSVYLSACVASTDAIGDAMEAIRRGDADIVLCGGADSMINPMGLGGFCSLGALSTKNEMPKKASRPFDETRDGFVLGEGAGFIVLESEEHAKSRNAKIYASILGFGNSLDAYSVSDPHPEGTGALMAMEKALKSSGINREEISAINAHGTSTLKNDVMETIALKKFFNDRVLDVPVFATKSMIGHTISASGAIETIACILSLMDQKVHPTINTEKVAENCQLNHVLNETREMKLNYILKNSFAFGGHNACLILGREHA